MEFNTLLQAQRERRAALFFRHAGEREFAQTAEALRLLIDDQHVEMENLAIRMRDERAEAGLTVQTPGYNMYVVMTPLVYRGGAHIQYIEFRPEGDAIELLEEQLSSDSEAEVAEYDDSHYDREDRHYVVNNIENDDDEEETVPPLILNFQPFNWAQVDEEEDRREMEIYRLSRVLYANEGASHNYSTWHYDMPLRPFRLLCANCGIYWAFAFLAYTTMLCNDCFRIGRGGGLVDGLYIDVQTFLVLDTAELVFGTWTICWFSWMYNSGEIFSSYREMFYIVRDRIRARIDYYNRQPIVIVSNGVVIWSPPFAGFQSELLEFVDLFVEACVRNPTDHHHRLFCQATLASITWNYRLRQEFRDNTSTCTCTHARRLIHDFCGSCTRILFNHGDSLDQYGDSRPIEDAIEQIRHVQQSGILPGSDYDDMNLHAGLDDHGQVVDRGVAVAWHSRAKLNDEDGECCICFDTFGGGHFCPSNHMVCVNCLLEWRRIGNGTCPRCRANTTA